VAFGIGLIADGPLAGAVAAVLAALIVMAAFLANELRIYHTEG
jgi:hypothetical protein